MASFILNNLAILLRRDASSQVPGRPQLHTVPARPFNRIGVWAYLAFTFILLAVATVLAYMLYSCYHSARANQRHIRLRTSGGLTHGNARAYIPGLSPKGFDGELRTRDTIGGSREKDNVGESRSGKKAAKVRTLGLPTLNFGHRKYQSESEHDMIPISYPNGSQNSLANVNEMSFELDNHYLTSPPLAHTSDRSAAHIPFHLPPPPPSPTIAHKVHLERQKQQYRRSGSAQYSPVSPSPSFCPVLSPPLITAKAPRSRDRHPRGSQAQSGCANAAAVQLDSNNIRFAPPLNPFMDRSAVLLWSEPKLSPIHGSIITDCSRPASPEAAYSYPMLPARALDLSFSVDAASVTPKKGARLMTPPLGQTSRFMGNEYLSEESPKHGKTNPISR